jgi:epoxyqueuosine reductase QueG
MPSADEILHMGEEDFEKRFGRTSLARPGMNKIKSNLRAARSEAPPAERVASGSPLKGGT